jgi:hypothetical protein
MINPLYFTHYKHLDQQAQKRYLFLESINIIIKTLIKINSSTFLILYYTHKLYNKYSK